MLDLTTPSQTLRLRVLIGWGSSFLLGIRASYSKYFHHVTKNYLILGICQIFYTSKILKFLNFTREKRANRDIFGQLLTTKIFFFIPFEQIVSFCAIIYSNTNSIQLFCKNSSLSWVIVCVNFLTFYPSPKMFLTNVIIKNIIVINFFSFRKKQIDQKDVSKNKQPT